MYWHIVFWASLFLLAYTYFGYPFVIGLLSKLRRREPPTGDSSYLPSVEVILVGRNEEDRVIPRLENLFSADYPGDLSVLLVSDGSDDQTAGRAREYANSSVRVVELPVPGGKAAGLAVALSEAKGEILIMTDARQSFANDTISRLVAHFTDPGIGAVSGALEILGSEGAIGQGVDAYWRLEKWLRSREADFDSSVGCTGAVYALRRSATRPEDIPGDTILDDVVIPMHIALRGYRVLFDDKAIATDPQPLSAANEARRKMRTLGGNFQLLFRYPGWLFPGKNRIWWQFISHKHMRIMAPLFFALLLLANLMLGTLPFYQLLLAGQILFYLAALVGRLLGKRNVPFYLRYPAALVFLNIQVIVGCLKFLRGDFSGGWRRDNKENSSEASA